VGALVGLAALAVLLASCGPSEARLEVALSTDAIAGIEFRFVEIELFAPEGPPEDAGRRRAGRLVRSARAEARVGQRFDSPRTVAHLLPVAPGRYLLAVRLLARDALRPRLSRRVTVDLTEDRRVVVRLDRACFDVECPRAGDTGTECLGGRCVEPACAASPASCPRAAPRPSASTACASSGSVRTPATTTRTAIRRGAAVRSRTATSATRPA
jgi:hypothetical protein